MVGAGRPHPAHRNFVGRMGRKLAHRTRIVGRCGAVAVWAWR
ncbi:MULTISPECIES: hypothetical protein [Nitrosomonas]|nr:MULTISPECIES: hypothetical protein [Nitrosomonas]UVS60039.1 hypothetical protein NX761_10855 [Nitrosomonas sp. PLL12]